MVRARKLSYTREEAVLRDRFPHCFPRAHRPTVSAHVPRHWCFPPVGSTTPPPDELITFDEWR
eukprot:6789674-Heterocapsa_arctica.AAC.1